MQVLTFRRLALLRLLYVILGWVSILVFEGALISDPMILGFGRLSDTLSLEAGLSFIFSSLFFSL